MNNKGLGIRAKLMLLMGGIVFLALIVYAVIVSIFLTDRGKNLQFQSLEKSVTSVAAQIAMQLDGDDIVALVESGEPNDPAGNHTREVLSTAFDLDPNVGWIYTAVPDPDNAGQWLFVTVFEFDIDGTTFPDEEDFLQPYEPLEADPEFASDIAYISDAFDQGVVTLSPYEHIDEFGALWLNGFAPVYDSNNEVVALVGVDVSGDEVINVTKWVRELVGFSTIAVLIPLLIGVWFMSGALVRPITDIQAAAKVVEDEEQHFEDSMLASVVTRKDELGELARIFSHMAKQVENRVDNLKAEVAQLKIEIDQSKRSQDVEELRSSDYYKKLKDTAQAYRAAQGGGEEEASKEEKSEDA